MMRKLEDPVQISELLAWVYADLQQRAREAQAREAQEERTGGDEVAEIQVAAAIGRAGARARTRVYAREELADLADYYCATYDRQRMPPAVQRDMCAALDAGMEPEVLMLAMDDAARIDRPSWTYALAIIKRCLSEGCRTTADWERRKAAHAAAYAQRARTVREPYANRTRDVRAPYANGKALQDYAQREYHDEDFAVDAVMQMWMEQEREQGSAK